jgi:hypothetical protein
MVNLTFAFLKLYMSHKTLAIFVKIISGVVLFTRIRLEGIGNKAEFNILVKIYRCKPH